MGLRAKLAQATYNLERGEKERSVNHWERRLDDITHSNLRCQHWQLSALLLQQTFHSHHRAGRSASYLCLRHPSSLLDILGQLESHPLSYQGPQSVEDSSFVLRFWHIGIWCLLPTPSWEWKPLTLVLGGLDGSVASSSVLPGFFQSLPSLKRILKQTSVKSSQLPCIDVARVSYSSDLKRKQNQGLEFSQVPTKPCPPPPPHYFFILFSWRAGKCLWFLLKRTHCMWNSN